MINGLCDGSGLLVVVGLVGLLPGRLVAGRVVGRGRLVVIIGFLVVVGLVGLLPGRLVIVGLAVDNDGMGVVHDGLAVVHDGIAVVNFGPVHGLTVVVVRSREESNTAQEALQ